VTDNPIGPGKRPFLIDELVVEAEMRRGMSLSVTRQRSCACGRGLS